MNNRFLVLVASALAAGALSGPVASAAPLLELVATSQDPAFSGFEVVFDDLAGDGLLRLNEVTSFSGVTANCAPDCSIFESKLLLVPDLAAVAAGTGGSWGFGNDASGNSLQAAASDVLWSYSTVPAPVPEPAMPALLSMGLAAFAAARLWRAFLRGRALERSDLHAHVRVRGDATCSLLQVR